MKPMSRRSTLMLGGVGTAFVLAGGARLVWDWFTNAGFPSPSTPRGELAQPRML